MVAANAGECKATRTNKKGGLAIQHVGMAYKYSGVASFLFLQIPLHSHLIQETFLNLYVAN